MRHFKLVIFFVFLLGFGLFFSISSAVDLSKASKTDVDFNSLDKSEFKDGMFVKGIVYEVYDEYAYETTDSRVSNRYYIVPLLASFDTEVPQYVTVSIGNTELQKKADSLMKQTWDYYDYGTEPAVWDEFEIVGEVKALDVELLGYLYEWFMYGDSTATREDYSQYICPYEISFVSIDGMRTGAIMFGVMALVGAIGLSVFIVIFIKARSNSY